MTNLLPLLPELSGPAVKVFMAFKIHKNGGPPAAPIRMSTSRLCEATGLVASSAASARKEAEAAGLIRVVGPDTFQLLAPVRPWLPEAGCGEIKRKAMPASTPDIINLVDCGLRAMGTKTSLKSRYGVAARKAVMERQREGHSAQDLMTVLEWARRRRENGDTWAQWRNLLYIWGRQLPAHISAMNAESAAPGVMQYRAGEARTSFDADAAAAAQRPLPQIL